MAGVRIITTGLTKILQKMHDFPVELQVEVMKEFSIAADEVVREAFRNAPADQGQIGRSIIKSKEGGNIIVGVQAVHGVFQETGTKTYYSPPRGFGGYFSRFKGLKTSGNPIDALQGWVKRKGLAGTYSVRTRKRTGGKKINKDKQDRQLAFLIFRKIKRYGIKPHPFLFPAFVSVRRKSTTRINAAIRRAIKK